MTPDRKTTAKPRGLFLALAAAAMLAMGVFITSGAGAASSGGIGGTTVTSASDGGKERLARKRVNTKFRRIWRNQIGARDRRWANKTAECESGRDPDAIGAGGRYRGAFQFMRRTWKSSPGSPGGDPIDYSYATQAVVAVKLKRRDGRGHWPVCG